MYKQDVTRDIGAKDVMGLRVTGYGSIFSGFAFPFSVLCFPFSVLASKREERAQ